MKIFGLTVESIFNDTGKDFAEVDAVEGKDGADGTIFGTESGVGVGVDDIVTTRKIDSEIEFGIVFHS